MSDNRAPTPPSSNGGATPAVCSTTPCPATLVHARVRIKEITFADNHTVDKDTLGTFTKPEWITGRTAMEQSPISYTRNIHIKLTPKFTVTQDPTQTDTVNIRASTTINRVTMTWTGSVSVNPSDTEVTASLMTSDVTLPNAVACVDPTTIEWEQDPPDVSWLSAGSSAHVLYVTLGNPTGTPAYWTLLDISCRAAHGETTDARLVSQSFRPFTTRALNRKRDGHNLTYWNPDTTTATGTRLLLASLDGSGQCGSWAEMLRDMWRCHGFTGADKVEIRRPPPVPRNTELFLVKNWRFLAGSKPAPWTHLIPSECSPLPGVAGQRNPSPPPAFYNHFVVVVGTELFDPSYGVGPVATTLGWENGAIDGLAKDVGGDLRAGYQKSTLTTTQLLQFQNLRTGAII